MQILKKKMQILDSGLGGGLRFHISHKVLDDIGATGPGTTSDREGLD